jgi:hypothetical protein
MRFKVGDKIRATETTKVYKGSKEGIIKDKVYTATEGTGFDYVQVLIEGVYKKYYHHRFELAEPVFKKHDLVVFYNLKDVCKALLACSKPGEVLKLGGQYWDKEGGMTRGMNFISEQHPKGNGFTNEHWIRPSKLYKIRHATPEEIAKSQWSDNGFVVGQWYKCSPSINPDMDILYEKTEGDRIHSSAYIQNRNLCKTGSKFHCASNYSPSRMSDMSMVNKYYKGETDTPTIISEKNTNSNGESSGNINSSETSSTDTRRVRETLDVSQLGRRGEGLETSDRRREAEDIKLGEGRRRSGKGICSTRSVRRSIDFVSRP